MAANAQEEASVTSVVVMMMVLWSETTLVCLPCPGPPAVPFYDLLPGRPQLLRERPATSCQANTPLWRRALHPPRRLLSLRSPATALAPSRRCVARDIQDACSQPTALRPRPSRFRQAIPRSDGNAQAEHAKVRPLPALRVPRRPSEGVRRYIDVIDEPRHLGRP
jgi:hypothetical protein